MATTTMSKQMPAKRNSAGVLLDLLGGDFTPTDRVDARTVAMPNRMAAPPDGGSFKPRNRLLAALPSREFLSLQPYLEPVPLGHGSALLDVDESLTRVYFVETGVASLLAAFEDRAIGVAAVGGRSTSPVWSWAATMLSVEAEC